MPTQDAYRQATRADLDLAVQWAANEGWNPGLHDADIFWETDPEGFVCIQRGGEVIGTGSIISYGAFGFMGFFIVKKGLRGQGIGAPFWHWRKQRLQARLRGDKGEGTAIGMDGVFAMQPFYAKGGFQFAHRNLRMEGVGQPTTASLDLTSLSDLPFNIISEYDQRMFGCPRETFLRRWIAPAEGLGLGALGNGGLRGYGVIRKCLRGYKIGPLFADDAETAEDLFQALSNHAAGAPIFLDVPEINEPAMNLARRHQMTEQFGCARMYLGNPAKLPWPQNIYGVTTFELG